MAAEKFWADKQRRLRQLILSSDPRAFLTWDVVCETMFPAPYARFARLELNALKRSGEWRAWRRVIREESTGLPLPCLYYPFSSANAIHHAYHLYRFQVEAGAQVSDFEAVCEFGGGYGSLCRIAHRRGFRGKYLIFDLPEQSALQRYYLQLAGIRDVETVSVIETRSLPGRRLFVATWSLSEAPLELRDSVASAAQSFDAFLIAYQDRFFEIDNCAFFAEWQTRFPNIRWKIVPIAHFPGNSYLFGVRS